MIGFRSEAIVENQVFFDLDMNCKIYVFGVVFCFFSSWVCFGLVRLVLVALLMESDKEP